jgi:hypothetical protein
MNDEMTAAQREFFELVTKKEPLHPDLKPWLRDGPMGLMLNSPLVQDITVNLECCALLNKRYDLKREALARAREKKNWDSYIFLHERPYRLDALCDLVNDDVLSDQQYWELVGHSYQDSENIWQNQATWKGLLNRRRPEKHFLMGDEEERAKLAGMPDLIHVYRGIRKGKNRRGLSWTLSMTKAMFFARRYDIGKTGLILHGEVKREDVHCLLLGRGEFEIVANKVKIVGEEKAPQHQELTS